MKNTMHVKRTFPPKPSDQPSAIPDGQNDCVRDKIAGQQLRALVVARSEIACDVRQSHISDACVEIFMNAASETTTAMIHGFPFGCHTCCPSAIGSANHSFMLGSPKTVRSVSTAGADEGQPD